MGRGNATRFSVPSSFEGNVRDAARRQVSMNDRRSAISATATTGKTGLFMVLIPYTLTERHRSVPLAPALVRAFRELHPLGASAACIYTARPRRRGELTPPTALGRCRRRRSRGSASRHRNRGCASHRDSTPAAASLPRLDDAIGKPGHRRAVGAIDLKVTRSSR